MDKISIDKERPPIKVHDVMDLELRIHVLGYYPKGESILIVLWDDCSKSVCLSILVDCFQNKKVNRFDSLFQKYNLTKKKLNYFIWTHPDEDHSVGIPNIIKSLIGKETVICIPYGLSRKTFSLDNFKLGILLKNMIKYSDSIQSFISILRCSKKKYTIVEPVSNSRNSLQQELYGDIIKDNFGSEYKFGIEFLTPFRDISFTKSEANTSILKNDLSISFNVVFGQYRFFFGGDTENDSLELVKDRKLANTIFVKIPHHSSHSSDKLPLIYEKVMTHSQNATLPLISAVTTSFNNNANINLPNTNVLDAYKKCARGIYITKDKSVQSHNYGIWTFTYKYQSRTLFSRTREGDTEVYYEIPITKGGKKRCKTSKP